MTRLTRQICMDVSAKPDNLGKNRVALTQRLLDIARDK